MKKGGIKCSPWLWIAIQQDTLLPGSTKQSHEMPNHMDFLSTWRLSGSCLANHQGNWNLKVRESSTETALSTIWFEFPEFKARAAGIVDLNEEGAAVCQSWDLVWSLCLPPSPSPVPGTQREGGGWVQCVLNWAPTLWLIIPSMFLKMCLTDDLEENIFWCLINMHMP